MGTSIMLQTRPQINIYTPSIPANYNLHIKEILQARPVFGLSN